jgi:hypothetical protein
MSFGVSSSSNPATYSTAQTTEEQAGGTGTNSPTILASGNVNLTDGGATVAALNGMGTVSLNALNEMAAMGTTAASTAQAALTAGSGVTAQALQLLSDFNANEAAAQVQQSQQSTSLLASVLGNNQTLAENSQSGGATTGMDYSSKLIYAALAVVGVVVVAVLFKK